MKMKTGIHLVGLPRKFFICRLFGRSPKGNLILIYVSGTRRSGMHSMQGGLRGTHSRGR